MFTFNNTTSIKLSFVFAVIFLFEISNYSFAQCTANNALTIPSEYLSSGFIGNGNFNAVIFGNLAANDGDIEGRLAVNGNLNAPNTYSVGIAPDGRSTTPGTDNLVVNGTFTSTDNWSMEGNFVYNILGAGSALPTHEVGTGTNRGGVVDHIKFGSLQTHFENVSTTLAGKTATGSVVYTTFDDNIDILLTGTSDRLNVFEVTLPTDKQFDIRIVDVPSTSEVLINVINLDVVIKGGSVTKDVVLRANTLFNFPNAASIKMENFALEGALLAPNADFWGSLGNVNGPTVIGGDALQVNGFEFHNYCSSFTGTPSALPVTLTSFSVINEGKRAHLKWETTFETNSDHFEIQHSVNGKTWKSLGVVTSKGESSSLAQYHFTDSNPVNGKNYYRLKMIDRDGTFSYSRMNDVSIEISEKLIAYPNPVVDRTTLVMENWTQVKELHLVNMVGKRIALPMASGVVDMTNIGAGIYIIEVNHHNGTTNSVKVVKR